MADRGYIMSRELFPLGQVIITPRALDAILDCGERASALVARHVSGDWGIISAEDRSINEQSIYGGDRIFSCYQMPGNSEIWLITEWDRTRTILLLPDEF
jgi:hypothetical protein